MERVDTFTALAGGRPVLLSSSHARTLMCHPCLLLNADWFVNWSSRQLTDRVAFFADPVAVDLEGVPFSLRHCDRCNKRLFP